MLLQSDPAGERRKAHGALATASRVHILELLRSSGTPLDVQQIAAQRDLHPNTVRFHLKVLVDAGLACCRPDSRGASGRPRLVYTATTDVSGNRHPDGFRLLADILASYLVANSEIPAGLAEEAGRAFARRHRGPTQPGAEVSADEAVRRVAAMFAELGFEPELFRDGAHRRILLHACPFHAVAKEHPELVCAMHLGLLKQTLANFNSTVEVLGLEPYVTPHLCIAHLAAANSSPAAP
ncbi:MAG TPA: helix-turn-helix domain-containing protein [Pseudonocardiaceae bacterium]|nr:helix-turn-helix domain-containing protein [Pseudonocardiaceae bacterium]